MANETHVAAPETIQPAQADPQIANNFSAELDAALSKSFTNSISIPEKNETPKEEPQKREIKTEIKFEDKQEARPESKKEDKLPSVEKPLLTPDEIDKTDPKRQDAWTALKNNNKRSHSLLEQKEAEIAKLKAVVAERGQMSQKELDALKSENGELSKYRAMLDIQADPEFNAAYDTPMLEKIDSMKELLRGWHINEEFINGVDFLDKNRVGGIAKILRENEKHIASEFELEEFMSNAKEVLALSKKRDAALKTHGETYKETLEAKKKQAFEKDTESEGKALRHLETLAKGKDEAGNSRFPFLNRMEAKETASQLEMDQVNSHNKMVELMNQKVHQAFKMQLPEERMEVAVAAATAFYMNWLHKSDTTKIQALEAELKKISAVGTETEKSKSVSVKRNGNGKLMDTDEALAAHFNR